MNPLDHNPYDRIRRQHEIFMGKFLALDAESKNSQIEEVQEILDDELGMVADRWEIVSIMSPNDVKLEKNAEPITGFDALKKIISSKDNYQKFIELRDEIGRKTDAGEAVGDLLVKIHKMAEVEKKTLMSIREYLVGEKEKIPELYENSTPVPSSQASSSVESTPQNSPKFMRKDSVLTVVNDGLKIDL